MKRIVLSLIPLVAFAEQQKRWNIVYIMSDDHSYQAISAYGHQLSQQAPTPNLDRIAQQGMLFRKAYVENSLSTPSRACLMTGLYSHQNGQRRLDEGIDSTITFVSEMLHDAGYQTGIVGKWHMRCEPKGFEWFHVLNDQGEYYAPGFRSPSSNGKYIQEPGYVTDLITDHALGFLSNRDKERPFALFIHHKAPHRNWMPPIRSLDMYEDVQFPMPENFYDDYATRGKAAHSQEMNIARDMGLGYDLKVSELNEYPGYDPHDNSDHIRGMVRRMRPEYQKKWNEAYGLRNRAFLDRKLTGKELAEWKYQRYIRDYMRCIYAVDEQVGRVLDYLKQNNLMDNTMIVYTSDQGFYMGEHGWFDKRFMYEESFRTPLLIYCPGMQGGAKSDVLVQNIDYAPTFLDIAGVKKPKEMVGQSLLPVLTNEGKQPKRWRQYLYYHYYDFPAVHHVSRHDGVSDGRYKLIHFYGQEGTYDEMYDLQKDPCEMNNIIDKPEYASVQKRLNKALAKIRKQQKVDEC